jgi:hypothetical protein
VPADRTGELPIRRLDKLLDRVFALDRRPLTDARPHEKRVVGHCHHFVLLLVGMLRAKGRPATASVWRTKLKIDHDVLDVPRVQRASEPLRTGTVVRIPTSPAS